ncbi:RMD1 family protein [Pseudoalteromonas sp. G4]|uniref:RMD1 family protein n=1 Tax=Pseudoalteromonas sp. G4 TaxID=2992761 RepID=UPI00237DD2C7|nr:RMD1 family protein [Pseudoalteromonas sp. G4]MDE3272059.1 RMD1 family protein [Pseudoalteromonas sp. G4]
MSDTVTKDHRLIISFLGHSINKEKADIKLNKQLGAIKIRDAYGVCINSKQAWLFDYAVLVCWDFNQAELEQLIAQIDELIISPEKRPSIDHYIYREGEYGDFNIKNDCLFLDNSDDMTKLALSHALAQSTKLEFFEEQAQAVISENAYLSQLLAQTGKVPLTRKALAKLRGTLFKTSTDINLHFNLLDTPEFFWDNPNLEGVYQQLSKYLDLLPRIHILQKKLDTIHNLVDMLSTEQNHKHSAFLEWVIIILIAVDIAIYFF